MKLHHLSAIHTAAKVRRSALSALPLLLANLGFGQTTPPATAAAPEDEPIVLSPFIVDASQDKGYRATATLAGSRINTDLKDVAAPITVVTKEFMNDLSAVDVNDILAFTAGTEGTRDFTASQSSLGRPTDDVASNPNTANRIRGLEKADITRDYFYTIGTWAGFDTYNLDQVTISRGPNSALAGLGSVGGIINYSPQLAGLYQNKNQVSFRYGSFGDARATFNSNIVAKKKVLAFRVAGLWADRGFKQQPAWNKDKRLYLSSTYQPWSKTTIRANYEQVKVDANNPNSITPEDSVTQWVNLGRPSYDRNSSAPVSSYLWRDGDLPTVMYNKDGTPGVGYNVNNGYYFNQQNLANVGIWTAVRMNSNKYMNLDRINTQPSLSDLDQKTFSLSIDQEIARGLNANLSYINEKVDNEYLSLFRAEYATYDIDVNVRLPDGSANPHYGESYMLFRGLDNKQFDHNTNEIVRGTLTYDFDLTKRNKWFGHYRVTGFGEKRETETQHLQYNARSSGGTTKDKEIGYRYYLGGTDSTLATTVPTQPGLVSGANYSYFDSGSSSWKSEALSSYYALKSDALKLEKLTTQALVLQGWLLEDRLVGMFGVRKDKDESGYSSSVDGGSGIVTPAKREYGTLTEASKQTKSYGAVAHPLKWLSFHYNRSENFRPNAGAVDLLGKSTPSPTGKGKDYGFSMRLLDDKLYVKFNWFEATAAGGAADNANFPLAQWTIPFIELTVMPEIAKNAGIAYKQAMAPGLITGDPRLANAYTSDNVSKGLEIEVTYNVTKNWRLMASVAKQEAKQSNIAGPLTAFIEERLAYWKSIPQLWTGPATGGSAWGLAQTGQQHWEQFDQFYYLTYKAAEGKPAPQLAKWHGSVLTNYSFDEGKLKGFNFGTGLRYIEQRVIGNPAIVSGGVVTGLDLDKPYYAGGYIAVDAWFGYKMKVLNDKYDLSFQVNMRDLEQEGGFRPIQANSNGEHSVYRIVQPRTFYLTTTLEF